MSFKIVSLHSNKLVAVQWAGDFIAFISAVGKLPRAEELRHVSVDYESEELKNPFLRIHLGGSVLQVPYMGWAIGVGDAWTVCTDETYRQMFMEVE